MLKSLRRAGNIFARVGIGTPTRGKETPTLMPSPESTQTPRLLWEKGVTDGRHVNKLCIWDCGVRVVIEFCMGLCSVGWD